MKKCVAPYMCIGAGAKIALSRFLDVQLPVPVQRSLLGSFFTQEEVQCCGNSVGALAKLFRQVVLAHNHIPRWIALMDSVSVGRNLVCECTKFLFLPTLRTLSTGLIGLQTPPAHSCNSDSSDQYDPPVQCNA